MDDLNWSLVYKKDGMWLRYVHEDGKETLLNLGDKDAGFAYLNDEMSRFGWEE